MLVGHDHSQTMCCRCYRLHFQPHEYPHKSGSSLLMLDECIFHVLPWRMLFVSTWPLMLLTLLLSPWTPAFLLLQEPRSALGMLSRVLSRLSTSPCVQQGCLVLLTCSHRHLSCMFNLHIPVSCRPAYSFPLCLSTKSASSLLLPL